MAAGAQISYSPDSIDPDYNLGLSVSVGGGVPTSATIQAAVASPQPAPSAAPCLTCGNGIMGLSWPIIIIVVAVLVLAFRE